MTKYLYIPERKVKNLRERVQRQQKLLRYVHRELVICGNDGAKRSINIRVMRELHDTLERLHLLLNNDLYGAIMNPQIKMTTKREDCLI